MCIRDSSRSLFNSRSSIVAVSVAHLDTESPGLNPMCASIFTEGGAFVCNVQVSYSRFATGPGSIILDTDGADTSIDGQTITGVWSKVH